MAGTMVHLMIADILAQEWTGKEIITPYGSTRVEYDYFIAEKRLKIMSAKILPYW